MRDKARFVFDANAIISAFLFDKSTPGLALEKALMNGELLLSLEVAEELASVLRRDKFDRYVHRKVREEFLKALILESVFIESRETIRVCRDPADDKFLELAVSGSASHLITGDEGLLALNPFKGISILSPKEFLNISLPT